MNISFGPFAPDRSQFSADVLQIANNVLPSPDGVAPFPTLAIISQALADTCRGACYARTSDGTNRIIAGTSTRLYELNTTDYSWTDITGAAGPYNLAVGDYWTFTRYGDELIIHNINNPIQTYAIETGGTVTTLAGSPPQAKFSWVAGDFLVLGCLNGGPSQARSVYWSGVNNSTVWTIGDSGCDTQELPEGNDIVGGFGETGGFTVIQRDGMQFFPFALESGFTFARQIVNPKQGCVAPRSIVSIGPGQFFYLSEDGFFGGVNRQPIGATWVDNTLISEAGQNILDVQGAADPYRKMVWWRYKTVSGAYKRLGYHWQLDRWVMCDVDIGELVPLATPSITWDGLDALYATIDGVTEAFDSRLFFGGRPTMAAFSTDNKLGYFEGPNAAATIQTGAIQFDDVGRTFVNELRVITDAQTFTVADAVSPYHGGTETWSSEVSPHPRTKMVHFRQDGRLHKLRLTIPEGTVWTVATGMNVNAQVTGAA